MSLASPFLLYVVHGIRSLYQNFDIHGSCWGLFSVSLGRTHGSFCTSIQWHIYPVTTFGKEVWQESTRKLQSPVMDPVANRSPAPPFLERRGRSSEIQHGASFTCKCWRLRFRPPSGTVEQGCDLGECSLIIIHMLWILNGRVQSPRDWEYWEGLSFLSGGMAWPSDESHYSSASAAFMASEKIISRSSYGYLAGHMLYFNGDMYFFVHFNIVYVN